MKHNTVAVASYYETAKAADFPGLDMFCGTQRRIQLEVAFLRPREPS